MKLIFPKKTDKAKYGDLFLCQGTHERPNTTVVLRLTKPKYGFYRYCWDTVYNSCSEGKNIPETYGTTADALDYLTDTYNYVAKIDAILNVDHVVRTLKDEK